MKKLIEKIRDAKTWRERATLAEDKLPGTPFDRFFQMAQEIKKDEKRWPDNARRRSECLGTALAQIINSGDFKILRKMANALYDFKHHEPKPDKVLIVLFSMAELFPTGWQKKWMTVDRKTGRLIPCPKAAIKGRQIAMRDIKINLERIDPAMTEDQWNADRKRVQRYAREFGIKLDSTGGRPVGKTAT